MRSLTLARFPREKSQKRSLRSHVFDEVQSSPA
jgi:hypothetical protein